MSQPVALVTGAGGEVGRLLIPALRQRGYTIVTVDLLDLPADLAASCRESAVASILDRGVMRRIFQEHRPELVFHLAAVLSAKAERDPDLAHRINVDGTLALFDLSRRADNHPRFVFPSSIAVYGLPDAATKQRQGAVRETEWTVPAGVYGCNKLYCELLGSFLARRPAAEALDFRALRFPGLISAETLPTSGTTDYAPAMIHAAAGGEPYTCFVREDSALPFMTMPDAVEALVTLALADPASLSTRVYNLRGFSASAGRIREEVLRHFPDARIDFEPIPGKQALVDSWPADVDDAPARHDWGLAPRHGLAEALADYLLPGLRRR